jgi:hypothetical protein
LRSRSSGYSRLIGADEASTLQTFKAIRDGLFDPTMRRLDVWAKVTMPDISKGCRGMNSARREF